MAGEKYVVGAVDNPSQIAVRNILNQYGYVFLGNTGESISLMRLIRSYAPEFVVVDVGGKLGEFRNILETIDDEMLCACIVVSEFKSSDIMSLIDSSKVISFCPKPLNRDVFINTVEISNLNFKRILDINTKLKEMTENYETRKVVERAKWILMDQEGINEKEAYEKIRKKSMSSRMSMKSISEAIIMANEFNEKIKSS